MNDFIVKLNEEGFIFKKCSTELPDSLSLESYIEYLSKEINSIINVYNEE